MVFNVFLRDDLRDYQVLVIIHTKHFTERVGRFKVRFVSLGRSFKAKKTNGVRTELFVRENILRLLRIHERKENLHSSL